MYISKPTHDHTLTFTGSVTAPGPRTQFPNCQTQVEVKGNKQYTQKKQSAEWNILWSSGEAEILFCKARYLFAFRNIDQDLFPFF